MWREGRMTGMCLCECVCMRERERKKLGEREIGWGREREIRREVIRVWLDIKGTSLRDIQRKRRSAPQRVAAGSQERLLVCGPGAYCVQINHFIEVYSPGGLVKEYYWDLKKRTREEHIYNTF